MKRAAILGGAALAAIAFSIRGRSPSQKRLSVRASISSEGSLATRPGKSSDGSAEPAVPAEPNRPQLPPADHDAEPDAIDLVAAPARDVSAEGLASAAIAAALSRSARNAISWDRHRGRLGSVDEQILAAIDATIGEAVASSLPVIVSIVADYHQLRNAFADDRRRQGAEARYAARVSEARRRLEEDR